MAQMHRRSGVIAVGLAAVAIATANPASAAYPAQARFTAGGQSAGTAITFVAVNTNVFVIRDLVSGVAFQCPVGGVTLTGTTAVGTSNNNPAATFTSAVFNGCRLANITAGLSPLQPWKVRANNPSSPSGGPVAGQSTPHEISGVLANLTIGSCTAKLGFGTTVAYPGPGAPGVIDNAGGASGVQYTNGNPSTIQIFTTATGASAKLGINATSGPCASGTIQPGHKVQFYGLASSGGSTPVSASFAVSAKVTSSGVVANPLWTAAT